MSVPYLSDIEHKPAIRFPEGNEIWFWMDFAAWRGIPSDRDFYIIGDAPAHHEAYYLAARGYGVQTDYGNGSIMVKACDVGSVCS